MSSGSGSRLELLRGRSEELMAELRQRRAELERRGGRKRDREGGEEEEEEEAVAGGERAAARAALAGSALRASDPVTSKHTRAAAERASPSDNHTHAGPQDAAPSTSHFTPGLAGLSQERSQDGCEELPATNGRRLPPLLGYDWIAGILEAEDSLAGRSDDFFEDLSAFRSLNKDECVHSPQTRFSEERRPVLPWLTERGGQQADADTHQCTFSYRINSRLFAVPLSSRECCPVCDKHKSEHPHTAAEPALVRVSVPLSTLLPPYKHKAHRRCSFEPSDSLGLPSHCLSGCSNTGQNLLPPPSSLDLRSSLRSSGGAPAWDGELEGLAAPGNRHSGQIPDAPRLARHNFCHFSPRRRNIRTDIGTS